MTLALTPRGPCVACGMPDVDCDIRYNGLDFGPCCPCCDHPATPVVPVAVPS